MAFNTPILDFNKGGAPAPAAPAAPQFAGANALQQYAVPAPPGAPAGPDYLAAFNQSLGASRSAIQSQLQGALQDIAHSQGLSQQAIGLMPGQLNALYGQAQGQINNDAGFLDQQLKGSGVLSGFTMPSQGAFMQPVQAALANTQAYNQAEVPLLQLGANDSFAKLRSQANNAAIGAQESLNSEDRNALASLAGNQMQNQAAQQNAYYNALVNAAQAQQNYQYGLSTNAANSANQLALYQQENGNQAKSPYLTTDAGNYSAAKLALLKGDAKGFQAIAKRDPGAAAAAASGQF